MTFRQLALNNVLRNRRVYAAYFLSSLFTVMVFFTFVNFAFHPALTGEGINANVTQGMLVAGGIIYIFSFFFILYSMSSFLQSRKKEFGIFMIHGMSHRQIRWMVFLENMLIGFGATIIGIGLGLIFSKVILLIAENVLVLDKHLHFYFPVQALLLSFFSFIVLFAVISMFITFILRTRKLVMFIQGDKIGKKEPKASILLSVVAFLLLATGYMIALNAKGTEVVAVLLPVVFIVIIGTYFFFTQLSVFIIHRLKASKRLFWKKTNMLLLSDLSFRMKDNARTFFMVSIISTVAFSAIGALIGFNSYLTEDIKAARPASFNHLVQEEEEIEAIEQTFAQYDLTMEKARVDLPYFDQSGEETLITTADDYNRFARLIGEEEIRLKPDEVTVVKQGESNMLPEREDLENAFVILDDGTEVSVDRHLLNMAKPNVLPEMFPYFIVGEDIFERLPNKSTTKTYVSWQVVDGQKEDVVDAGRELSDTYPGLFAVDYIVQEVQKVWSPVMFVGLFIGIVFFVAAGSFLYFRLYTDLDDDREKFLSIYKIGLTTKEMKRVVSRQLAILFLTPIVVENKIANCLLTTRFI